VTIDHGLMSESPTTPNGEAHSDSVQLRSESLEQRVRRLEDVMASLQDTRHLEDRVVERVASRINREPTTTIVQSTPAIVHAGRQLLPAALGLFRAGADQAEQQAVDRPESHPAPADRQPWLLFDVYAEARTMVHMYFDHRYHVSRQARWIPAMLLIAILTSWMWLSWLFLPLVYVLPTIISTAIIFVMDKIVNLVLAFLALKILSREVVRYRKTVAGSSATPQP